MNEAGGRYERMKKLSEKKSPFIHLFFYGFLLCSFFLSCTSQEKPSVPQAGPEAEPAPEPDLRIEKIELTDMTFDSIGLEIFLTVSNPAPFGITPSALDYSLEVGGEPVFSGTIETIQSISEKSDLTLSLPVKIETDKIKKISGTAGADGEFEYTLNTVAEILVPVTGIPIRISRSRSGSFPLPLLPEIRATKVDIKDFGARVISFELGLQVLNPNIFSVTCGKISYNFLVDEKNWVSGDSPKSYDLEPGRTQYLPVQVRFDYLQAGRKIVDVLVGDKTLDYLLLGNASASFKWKNIEAGPFNFNYNTAGTAVIIRPEQFGF